MIIPVSEVGGVVRPDHALRVLNCVRRVDVGPALLQPRLGTLQNLLGVRYVKRIPTEVRLEVVVTSESLQKWHNLR